VAQIAVGSGGLLTTAGTAFNASLANSGTAAISVASGGTFSVNASSVSLSSVTFNSNTTDTLGSVVFSGVLNVNSGATLSIHGNDFSNVGSQGIVATGDPSATIDFTGNFWGTSSTTQIQAKILDHFVNPTTRPTVNFGSVLSTAPASASILGVVYNDLNGNGARDSGEPGLGGVTVYIDVNNTGSLVSTDPSTVTNTLGQYSFNGLASGTYIVRDVPPSGTVQTAPSAAAVTTTIDFDGTGGEAGITGAGISSFTYHGASFSGGIIFAPPQGDSALLASGTLAYNASSNPATVTFSQPIVAATFFYVHGFGFGGSSDVATAYAADGSVVATVSSKAATTNDDPANFVTLTGSKTIVRITFVGGVVDNFTFSTINNTANSVVLSAGQTVNNVNFGDQFVPGAVEVQSLTPTSTGFTVTFNAPLNTSVLSLYGAGTTSTPVATLVGRSTGPVTGSLVVSPNGATVTFIKTGGLLAADTYTITLVSGANAFESTAGALLDGLGNGTPGSNLTSTFTVSPLASNAVVVSIPDFTRGYGQPVNVPASAATGLPVTISTGQNVTGVDFTLTYNPSLLTLSSFNSPITGAAVTANLSTPGTAVITISSPTPFSATAGAITLGDFTASVPNNASYGSKEILHISSLSVFDNSTVPQPLPAVGQDAIHVAAYLGDTFGGEAYTMQDVTLEQRQIGLVNSGFPFYQVADPVLIGDTSQNGQIQANDTTLIQRVIGQISVPSIPPLPTGLSAPPSGGPDPTLFIPDESGLPGAVVTVPVDVKVTESAGITVSSFQVAIAYDPARFTVNPNVQIGSMFAALGSPFVTFPAPGEIIVTGSSAAGTGTIPNGTTTDLFDMSFTVNSNAPNVTSVVNLLQNIGTTPTAIFANDANLTRLTLSPAPSNNASDPVDGMFTIGNAAATTTSGVVNAASVSVGPVTSGGPVTVTVTDNGSLSRATGNTVTLSGNASIVGPQIVANSGGYLTGDGFDAPFHIHHIHVRHRVTKARRSAPPVHPRGPQRISMPTDLLRARSRAIGVTEMAGRS
jgi:hypothetical protein